MVGVLMAPASRKTSAVDPSTSSMRNDCPPPARRELLGRDLARGRDAVSDVDDRGLFLSVDAPERDVEERAEIRRAPCRVLGQPLHGDGDLLLRRFGEPILRVKDDRGRIERDEREVVARGERAEHGLGGGGLLLARGVVGGGRGIDDDDEVGDLLAERSPVDVGDIPRHDVVRAVAARGEASDAER